MIVVTGGAGMIGSNIIKALNDKSISDILVVDDLSDGRKIFNLNCRSFTDFVDKDDFLEAASGWKNKDKNIEAIFHLGACSSTKEWNGKYLMKTNFEYSKHLYFLAKKLAIPFIYASSASVYGAGNHGFSERSECELPINAYAFSKWAFDNFVRATHRQDESPVIGLRYFNVYGPHEGHKGDMASVMFHLRGQLLADGELRLFRGIDGVQDGEQRRDFVHVDDCAAVNLWALDAAISGIYNVGTGCASSYNQVGKTLIKELGGGEIKYIEFPNALRGAYQNYTCADLSNLRSAGCDHEFLSIEEGIAQYMRFLARE